MTLLNYTNLEKNISFAIILETESETKSKIEMTTKVKASIYPPSLFLFILKIFILLIFLNIIFYIYNL